MEFLMLNKDKALTTQEIFNHIWARDADPEMDEGYVYIYISYLRQKLKGPACGHCHFRRKGWGIPTGGGGP